MQQKHLTTEQMTNFGCFYTPQKFVDKLLDLIKKNIKNYKDYSYLDSSCGYGTFLKSLYPLKTIGCDIDEKALQVAKQQFDRCNYFNLNTLRGFSRSSIDLYDNEKLIIVGNPPYNDSTSKVKNKIKKNQTFDIDNDIKTRDLGISFMLSYLKLNPDYIAILHPLSYMIKKSNYQLLKNFYKQYFLIDHCIINSQEFELTSKIKGFPIIIALYKKDDKGMSYENVLDISFKTIENETFSIKHDEIKNYINKYPSKNKEYKEKDILFWTIRDINALNRNQTFVQKKSDNTIIIDKDKFPYYCYVDAFKDYIDKLPYYFGNCEIFIDNQKFEEIKNVFVTKSMEKHPWLKDKISNNYDNNYKLIDEYFKRLFKGE